MKRKYNVSEMEYYPYYAELLQNNHILIGGRTGSGKSVLLNDFLYTILSDSPVVSQIVLIDPKKVELSWYKRTAHCLGYASDINDIVSVLDSVIDLMERRYKQMERRHIRLYDGNTIYVIIDELADLMISAKKEIMPRLQKIAQLGRASKIFLVCATQSPSRLTIPAALTLNYTCRIALQCFSAIESRQIIGVNGAEFLPRYGECLVKDNDGLSKRTVPLTSDEKLQERIRYWKNNKGHLCLF